MPGVTLPESSSPSFGNDPPLSECPEAIAIVGMGCRFPGGASDPTKLWDLLINKRTGYGDFPPDKLNIDGFYHPDRDRPGSIYTKGGYFLKEDPKQFDHGFFGITPLETMNLDPTQRKLLEVTYEAFENGGETLESLSGSRTGVYVGNIQFDHSMMQMRDADFTLPYLTTGGSQTILSNRVNYVFNLKGPSLSLDTACSSSMYALHLAVNAIKNNDCDSAVVAGTQLILGPETQISCARLGAISPTSTCHTFDASADGYARAEGFGALYIKRLSDAVAHGDPIRAVIRGTAANTNGRTAGIAHPSPEGQEAVIRAAYRNAGGLDINLTGYFECHGTGTPVGDPLEVSAIGRVFASGRSPEEPLLIGSIKTNLGHAEAASGVAGVMKAVLAIENGIVPPTIGLVKPNPNIDFSGARVKVVADSTAWPDKPIRRASVNSFGFGGANAHCILEHVSSVVPGYASQGRRRRREEDELPSLTKLPPSDTLSNGAVHTNGVLTNGHSNGTVNGHTNGEVQKPRNVSASGLTNGHHEAKEDKYTNTLPGLIQNSSGTRKKVLLPFSARDEDSLSAGIAAISRVVKTYELADLSHTLSSRRSKFSRRAFAVVDTDNLVINSEEVISGSTDSQRQHVGFVFTGQGAQWPGMGVDLYRQYEAFRRSIEYQNRVLSKLRDAPSWKIEEILEERADSSKIHEPQYSQALCTAIQIALVDLLQTWNVVPVVSVGHSSGEIAAAYASGHTTAAEAIVAAYYRGKAVETDRQDGRMLAAGLGLEECQDYLGGLEDHARIACYNSPQSVTISGDTAAILEIQYRLNVGKVFNRLLKTGNNAYHSHHMAALGETYEELTTNGLRDVSREIAAEKASGPRPQTLWVSSVYPSKPMSGETCSPAYWRKNLESPVQFMQAVMTIAQLPHIQDSILCELGPHPALSGPLKQIRAAVENRLGPALASLLRGKDGLDSMLRLSGNLFLNNAPIDLTRVNATDVFHGHNWQLAHGSCCVDLPCYSYHYGPNVFYENRLNKEWRLRKHLRHDVLGARVPGCSKFRPVWRNILRSKDLPWLSEQKLDSESIFAPAGFIAMAVEAARQVHAEDKNAASISGYVLRDVVVSNSLVIPDNDLGVETVFDLRSSKNFKSKRTFEFNVSSVPTDGDEWLDLCSGSIEVETTVEPSPNPILVDKSARQIDIDRWYERSASLGQSFSAAFQRLSRLRARDGDDKAAAEVLFKSPAPDKESTYPIHPTVLDSIIQLAVISWHSGQTEKLKSTWDLKSIKKLSIWALDNVGAPVGFAVAEGKLQASKKAVAQAQLRTSSGSLLVELNGLQCESRASADQIEQRYDPCLKLVWKPDVTAVSNKLLRSRFPAITQAAEVGEKFDMLEELAIYTIVDMYESQKHTLKYKRDDELQHFMDWVQRNINYASEGKLVYGKEALAATPQERYQVIGRLMEKLEQIHEAKLINAIHRNLGQILSGETSGLNVALEGDLLTELYVSGISIASAYPQMLSIIDLIAHQNPRMNIIEVGGGTGGATRHIIKALRGDTPFKKYHNYTFTDVSSGFLSAVESEFLAHKNMIYKTLDLEVDPEEQGFEPTYDLVIASQVLHTTSSIQTAVQNARRLLKPGGKLVLLELTRVWLGAGIVLGTFPGYWNGLKDGRLDSPFVDKVRWQELLTRAGFSGIDISLDDHEDPYTLTSTMVATAIGSTIMTTTQAPNPAPVYVVYRDYIHPLGRDLQKSLEAANAQAIYVRLVEEHMIPPQSRVLSLIDIENSTITQCSQPELGALKSLLSRAGSVLWVYAGNAMQGFKPESGASIGLLRTLVTELPHVRFASLGLSRDFTSNLSSTAHVILHREELLQTIQVGTSSDHEYILQGDAIHISRLEPEERLNSRYMELEGMQSSIKERALDSVGAVAACFGTLGDVSTLHFQSDSSFCTLLKDDMVDVKIQAVSVQSRVNESEAIEGLIGYSGLISQVGSSVVGMAVGDRVHGVAIAKFSNYVRGPASLLQKIPTDMSFVEAASLPPAYMSAIQGLGDASHCRSGQCLLVLAADSVNGMAALKLARLQSADVYAVVEDESKVLDALDAGELEQGRVFAASDKGLAASLLEASQERGFDTIFSAGSDDDLFGYLPLVSPLGTIYHAGSRRQPNEGQLYIEAAKRNATFSAIDLGLLVKKCPWIVASIIKEVGKLIHTGIAKSFGIVESVDVSQMEQAINQANDRRIVLTFDNPLATIKIKSKPIPVSLDPNAAYLLVGCLGGLGRSISTWMADHGARRLVFVSRSGAWTPGAVDLIEELQTRGVVSNVIKCSVTDQVGLSEAVDRISKKATIKGVVHAAMVEGDAAFANTTFEQVQRVLAPKVDGTLNLHNATLKLPLDFFIMTSSIVAMVGTATQGLYSAANAFQDSFARYRKSFGLAAQSIAFGPILEVGFLSDLPSVRNALMRNGLYSQTEYEFLRLFESALANESMSTNDKNDPLSGAHIITGLEPRQLHRLYRKGLATDSPWHTDARFARLLTAVEDLTLKKETKAEEKNVLELLKDAAPKDRRSIISQAVCERLARLLYLTPGSVDPKQSLSNCGMDSMIAAELRNWLFKTFQVDIPFLELLSPQTKVVGLVDFVLEKEE